MIGNSYINVLDSRLNLPAFNSLYMKVSVLGFLLLSLRLSSQPSPVTLEYHLELFEKNIHVELLYHPAGKDSSSFTYGQPAFGGQKIFSAACKMSRSTPPIA